MISTSDKEHLIVGYKQVLKALKNNSCKKVFIAEDCSSEISDSLTAETHGIETVFVETMSELGSMCGIDVPSSCAAVCL